MDSGLLIVVQGEVRTEDATSGIDLAATFATLEGQTLTAQIGEQRITADLIVYPYGEERLLQMWVAGVSHVFHWAVPHRWERSGAAASADGSVVTPMPGKIVKVHGSNRRCREHAAYISHASSCHA